MQTFSPSARQNGTKTRLPKRTLTLISLAVFLIILGLFLVLPKQDTVNNRVTASYDLSGYSNQFIEMKYPKGWSKSGNLYSIKITEPNKDASKENLEYIQIERYGKVSLENSFESIKLREQADLSGSKLEGVSTEKKVVDNKTILVVRAGSEGGTTQKSYIFGKEYIWKMTIVTGSSTELENSISAISDSLKLKE